MGRRFKSGEGYVDVLRGASLCIEKGDTVSIQGESGSGKSTFLNIMAGLDRPDSGFVKWNSIDLVGYSRPDIARKRASLIGMVFQSYYLVPELRALENVMLGGRIAGSVENLRERSEALLERVGLADRMNSLPTTLSGGERQRVAIARALVTEPQAILADEPTGNLDESTGDSIMELLLSICEEARVALVLVTHNSEYAFRMGQSWALQKGVLERIPKPV